MTSYCSRIDWSVSRFEELDSTNRLLMDAARSGSAAAGEVCVADFQTAGRGRLGRTWEAPPGSALLCSILLRPGLPAERLHLVTAAVAVAGAQVTGAGIKWPNDLVVDRPGGTAKLAGVLAEAAPPWVVVGIGLNLTAAPPGAATLAELGDGRSRDEVLDALLGALAPLVGDWPTVAKEYRRRCVTLGREVRVELPDAADSFSGVAADVDDDGHLLVETEVCLKTVAAGDIVHLR
jgi:BirA family biotin operon repressor/biotin-[acetyl-CoA-carboxylase] ligase